LGMPSNDEHVVALTTSNAARQGRSLTDSTAVQVFGPASLTTSTEAPFVSPSYRGLRS
jgi:hypothetical protein